MDVAPHPHIGLQTVTWLLDGEVLHDDSLGSQSILRPGAVNVMTSGAGIAHAEQTPREHSGRLNGVQLWVALPDLHRNMSATSRMCPMCRSWMRQAGARTCLPEPCWASARAHRTIPICSAPICNCTLAARWMCRSSPYSSTPSLSWKVTVRLTANHWSRAFSTTWAPNGPPRRFPAAMAGGRCSSVAPVPGDDPDVVELRSPHTRRDCTSSIRLGSSRAFRRRARLRRPRLSAPSLLRFARPNPAS